MTNVHVHMYLTNIRSVLNTYTRRSTFHRVIYNSLSVLGAVRPYGAWRFVSGKRVVEKWPVPGSFPNFGVRSERISADERRGLFSAAQ